MSVNRVILVGNLGKDPEVRYMPNGDAVANFSIGRDIYVTDEEYYSLYKVSVYLQQLYVAYLIQHVKYLAHLSSLEI